MANSVQNYLIDRNDRFAQTILGFMLNAHT